MPNPAIQPLTQLIEEFLSGIVDPVFFEREFFNVFYVSSQLGWTSVESKILHDFFGRSKISSPTPICAIPPKTWTNPNSGRKPRAPYKPYGPCRTEPSPTRAGEPHAPHNPPARPHRLSRF